jgi:hypothetical protein
MAAASHSPQFAKKAGIKQNVAREFNMADAKTGILKKKKKAKMQTGGAPGNAANV